MLVQLFVTAAQSAPRVGRVVLGLLVLWLGLIGFSSEYLGMHWPTDGFAGYAAGGAYPALCSAVLSTSVGHPQ